MILIIVYTLILLFFKRETAALLCMQALKQWYETMIPALFPIMLFSSILVDTDTAQKLGGILNHTLLKFIKISDNGCYCLLTGFLFGFPMGAKTTADMYLQQSISKKEAEYLLSFINCIGPMYTINLTHKLFPGLSLWKLLFGIYGTAFFYGILLRYTVYRKETFYIKLREIQTSEQIIPSSNEALLNALYNSIPKCGKSMLMLGGYMVLFQLFFLPLEHLLKSLNMITGLLYPIIEITGGFYKLARNTPLPFLLLYTAFTGFCCHIQTYSFIKPAGLSIQKYLLHKTILAVLSSVTGLLLNI